MRRGLLPSRERAREAIETGEVTVNGSVALKPARQVLPGDAIEVAGPGPRFVSRGGEKLQAGLDAFGVSPAGRRVIDVGSSTGGFTDCLLQAGAVEVIAVDVGRGQLHEKLRADPRVEVHERTDVRTFEAEPADLVTADLSFISLRSVLADLARLTKESLIALVKPQFEAGREAASKGRGVITDPEIWRQVLIAVEEAAAAEGLVGVAAVVSPVKGASGNVEFLVHFGKGEGAAGFDIGSLVSEAQDLA